jgi:hypothetical protein
MDFELSYDSSAMFLDNVSVGPFMEKDGGTALYIGEVDPGHGAGWRVNIGILEGPAEGVSGSGTILTFVFRMYGIPEYGLFVEPFDFRGSNDEQVDIIDTRGTLFFQD